MIRLAKDNGIPVASHDDDTIEKVDLMHALGVDICEFPINLETAHHAIRRGMHVAVGASNIPGGGSVYGDVNMKEDVLERADDNPLSEYLTAVIPNLKYPVHGGDELPVLVS